MYLTEIKLSDINELVKDTVFHPKIEIHDFNKNEIIYQETVELVNERISIKLK